MKKNIISLFILLYSNILFAGFGNPSFQEFLTTGGGAGGTVGGAGTSTDNAIVRWDGATGSLIQDSIVLISDTGNITTAGTLSVGSATEATLAQAHIKKSVDGSSSLLIVENSQANSAASTNETSDIKFGFGGVVDAARIEVGKDGDFTIPANEDAYVTIAAKVDGILRETARFKSVLSGGSFISQVGIGTNAPAHNLHIVSEPFDSQLALYAYNDSPTIESNIILRKARGFESAPTAIVNGDNVGRIAFQGYLAPHRSAAEIITTVEGVPSGTSVPGKLSFYTTPVGGSLTERMIIHQDGNVEIPGKLTVGGLIDPTGLVLDEQATVPGGAPAAGKGTIWVKNSTPNVLYFTDDAGTDKTVALLPSSFVSTDEAIARFNGITGELQDSVNGPFVADSGNLDMNGNDIILDADGNSRLELGTDDQIGIFINGSQDITLLADILQLESGTSLQSAGTAVVINDDLTINGGDITSPGALIITPASGSDIKISLATTGDFIVNSDDFVVDTNSGFVGINRDPNFTGFEPRVRLDVVLSSNLASPNSSSGTVAILDNSAITSNDSGLFIISGAGNTGSAFLDLGTATLNNKGRIRYRANLDKMLIDIAGNTDRWTLNSNGDSVQTGDETISGGNIFSGAAVNSTLFSTTTTGTVDIANGLTNGNMAIGTATGASTLFVGDGSGSGLVTIGSITRNVSIPGTLSLGSPLTVIATDPALRLTDSTAGSDDIQLSMNADTFTIGFDTDDNGIYDVTAITVASSTGNVGLTGDLSVTGNLTVNGDNILSDGNVLALSPGNGSSASQTTALLWNNNSGASANAKIQVLSNTSVGTGGGDAYYGATVGNHIAWSWGIDKSVGDGALVFNNGETLDGSPLLTLTTAGMLVTAQDIGIAMTPGSNSNSLWVKNDAGDTNNKFRIDGSSNGLYIIGNSGVGAAIGTSIILRTGAAGSTESNSLVVNGDSGTTTYEDAGYTRFLSDAVIENATPFLTIKTATGTRGGIILGNPAHGLERGYPDASSNDTGLWTTGGNIYLSANGRTTINAAWLETAGSLHIARDLEIGDGTTTGCVVDGDGTVLAGTCISDVRLKDVIGYLSKSKDKVSKINIVRFNWKNGKKEQNKEQVGVIAQQVKEIDETLVDDSEEYIKVDFQRLQFMFYKAIQETILDVKIIFDKVFNIDEKIIELENKNKELEYRLKELEKTVSGLQANQ